MMPPSSEGYVRNYKKEYQVSQSSSEEKKNRASRNAARREAMKSGKVKLGDGMDIDHADSNPRNNSKKNLKVKSKSANRSFPRNKDASEK